MILEEPKAPRADTFVAIVDAALVAWAKRWWLYLGLALASIAVEGAIAAFARYDTTAIVAAFCVIDGIVTAFVSINVAERGEVLRATLVRAPIVIVVLTAAFFIQASLFDWIFGSAEQTYYGMGILPALLVFGALGVAPAIAALDADDRRPLWALPGFALLQSFIYAATWPSLARLTLAGAMLAVPMMAQQLLEHWLATKGVPPAANTFWSNIPIDALTLAPFQAFFTYLYLDFKARDEAKR